MRGLYIHIPFCKQKCFYCDFNSYACKENLIDAYFKALKIELQSFCDSESSNEFSTVYIGGGTPSFVPSSYICDILSNVKCSGEVTLELNPGTITKEKLEEYKKAGINRLSIGLQSTNDEILRKIGRIHNFSEFQEAYNLARKTEFNNINVDLMFGLPTQKLEDVENSLNELVKINPEHVSCYSLIVHDELKAKNPKAFMNLPSDDEEREMYYLTADTLKNNGYVQYEISNFSKPGFESKHNTSYWEQTEYLGIGAGASSYINNVRYINESSIEKYIKLVNDKNFETLHQVEEVQNAESKLHEYMILKLRLLKGINIEKANEIFKLDILKKFEKEISKMQKLGLLEIVEEDSNEEFAKAKCRGEHRSPAKNKYLRLTKKGLDFANIVWEEFI